MGDRPPGNSVRPDPASVAPRGRAVIVSGAAGGLGRAVVSHLLARKCRVAALDNDFSSWDVAPDGDLVTVTVDLRSPGSISSAVDEAVGRLGGCDSVVAAAAVVDSVHRAEHVEDADWDLELEVNLGGSFRLARQAFPHLRDHGDGRVVFVSSVAATLGQPAQVAYSASKAGLLGLTKTLASEWAEHHILVNAVVPGMIETPKVAALPGRLRAALLARTPIGHFATPEEVAGAISFLLSPAARSMTGATIRMDGGFSLNGLALSRGGGPTS
jgi:NAD(P)-dependent dehydrogenase (short-subunit alcohol dehydrogenase family)